MSLLSTMQLLELAKEACPHGDDCHVSLSLDSTPMIRVEWRFQGYSYSMLICPNEIADVIDSMFASAKRSMQINKELGERRLSSSIPQRIMDDIALRRRFGAKERNKPDPNDDLWRDPRCHLYEVNQDYMRDRDKND